MIARFRDGCFEVTHPPFMSIGKVKEVIESMLPRLLLLKEKSSPKLIIDTNTRLETFSFSIQVIENNCHNYYAQLNEGILTVSCPQGSVYQNQHTQAMIRAIIEKYVRFEAKRIFPGKVEQFAKAFGFDYSEVKINKSRSRWGSCSGKKTINLSYYCLFLPEYLIDFVILHELCHTREMNHGERFWAHLDSVTADASKRMTKELKGVRIPL